MKETSRKVNTASSKSNLSIIGEGDVSLTMWNGGEYQTVPLKECLHVAGLSKNLFSVPSAVAKGVNVSMNQKQCIISDSNKTVALGAKVGNLYYLKTQVQEALVTEELEHRRMGHASSAPWAYCEICRMAKQSRKSFPNKSSQENDKGLVQSDVMGPFEVTSNSGMKYVATFIVTETRYVAAYPMRNKFEVVEIFQQFFKMITSKSNIEIKRLRSDNGGEYKKMKDLCEGDQQKGQYSQFEVKPVNHWRR